MKGGKGGFVKCMTKLNNHRQNVPSKIIADIFLLVISLTSCTKQTCSLTETQTETGTETENTTGEIQLLLLMFIFSSSSTGGEWKIINILFVVSSGISASSLQLKELRLQLSM